jgi:CMP-N,N'-diacetyllegionaminic acid synthase
MPRICTICARGGSKGVKNKNVRELLGKPLIAHTIGQAQASKIFDVIAVSSDSEEILTVAAHWGVSQLVCRPDELAGDAAPKVPAIRHCVETVEGKTGRIFDVIVDLDVTSPLRLPEDIIESVMKLETSDATNVITGMPARRSPYFNLVELNEQGYVTLSKSPSVPVFRRQDAPQCFDMNASIYVWRRSTLFTEKPAVFQEKTLLHVMPEERSIDIDNELDFLFVEFLASRGLKI